MNHKQIAKAELERCRKVAEERGITVPRYTVAWRVMRASNGRARMHYMPHTGAAKYGITLASNVAQRAGEAFAQTVAHELAHVICYGEMVEKMNKVYAGSQSRALVNVEYDRMRKQEYAGHGRRWREVMAIFGRPATVVTNYK